MLAGQKLGIKEVNDGIWLAGPEDFRPVKQMRLVQFDDRTWQLIGVSACKGMAFAPDVANSKTAFAAADIALWWFVKQVAQLAASLSC